MRPQTGSHTMFIWRNAAMESTAYAAPSTQSVSWWLILLQGIALLIIGLLLFTETAITLFMLVMFLGIYWLIGGIFDLVGVIVDRTQWGWRLFAGVIGVLAGLASVRSAAWAALIIPSTPALVLRCFGSC